MHFQLVSIALAITFIIKLKFFRNKTYSNAYSILIVLFFFNYWNETKNALFLVNNFYCIKFL